MKPTCLTLLASYCLVPAGARGQSSNPAVMMDALKAEMSRSLEHRA